MQCRTIPRLLSSRLAGRIKVTELRYPHPDVNHARDIDQVTSGQVAGDLSFTFCSLSEILSLAFHAFSQSNGYRRKWCCADVPSDVQVTLYQLLMEERYGQHIERGLLWYLREASPEVITRSPYEVQIPSDFEELPSVLCTGPICSYHGGPSPIFVTPTPSLLP